MAQIHAVDTLLSARLPGSGLCEGAAIYLALAGQRIPPVPAAPSDAGEKRRWQNFGPAARQTGATLSPLGASLVMAQRSRSTDQLARGPLRSTVSDCRDETGRPSKHSFKLMVGLGEPERLT